HAPARAHVGAASERRRGPYFDDAVGGSFAAASFFSNSAIGIAPGMRSPFSKMIVGVPLMRLSRPSARFLSTGVVQEPAVSGYCSFNIASSHALPGSLEHQIAFDFSTESGDRIGYRKTY